MNATPADLALELARHIDRVRRRQFPCREFAAVRDLPSGWIGAHVGTPPAEYPSSAYSNRVYWLAPHHPIAEHEVVAGIEAARELGCRRVYLWLAPWASDEQTEGALARAGAARWPHVNYVALARPTADSPPARPTPFELRVVAPSDAADVMRVCAPWYSNDGAETAVRLAEHGMAEIHAAFAGPRPVAIGLLTMNDDWAHLFAAGTEPESRGKGAQSALIAARVRRAAELKATWASCETNTVAAASLANLLRAGFTPRISWRVYVWDEPTAGATATDTRPQSPRV